MSDGGEEFSVELTHTKSLSPRVRGLTLRALGSPLPRWQPGQYVEIAFQASGQAYPYSIASAPSNVRPGEFELAISRSSLAPDLAVGSVLRARGPFGRLLRREPRGAALVLVAGGTGLAPLRALLQEDLSRPGDHPVMLLFGCRNEAEILWRAELEALQQAHPRFRFEPTLSRGESAWTGRRGYVQAHLLELLAMTPGAEVYLCGLSEMVRECRALLDEQGVPADLIVGEAY
ncbi:MAG: hypothetical protein R3B13_26230 [Polyangiaceae bacterium]